MKKILLALVLVVASSAYGEAKKSFDGSNTLAGAISKALTRSGYGSFLEYQGTGSGNGEKGLVNGDWGLAPMSREMKPDVAALLAQKGYTVTANVLALDGLSMFVKADHPIQALTLPQVVDPSLPFIQIAKAAGFGGCAMASGASRIHIGANSLKRQNLSRAAIERRFFIAMPGLHGFTELGAVRLAGSFAAAATRQ